MKIQPIERGGEKKIFFKNVCNLTSDLRGADEGREPGYARQNEAKRYIPDIAVRGNLATSSKGSFILCITCAALCATARQSQKT